MIARIFKGKLLRLFSSAVIDQGLLSAANLSVGLLLIRYSTDHEYALYVLAQSTILLLTSVHGAWVGGPLSVVSAKRSPELRRAMVGAIDASQSRFLFRLMLIVLALTPLAHLLGFAGINETLVIGAGVIAGWAALRRDYIRTLLLIYARPQVMLKADVLYTLLMLAVVLLAVFVVGGYPAAVAVLGLALGMWAGNRIGHASLVKEPGLDSGDAKPLWREMRPLAVWATVGVVIYWVYGQGYNYILATQLGTTAVAVVNASRLLLQPVSLLTVGVRGLLLPMAAGWLQQDGLRVLLRRLSFFMLGLAVISLTYYTVLWFARDWLMANVLKKDIPDLDRMILLWAGVQLLGMVRDLYQTVPLARERFKILAWLSGGSALICVGTMMLTLKHLGPAGALWGMVAAEGFNLGGVLFLVFREIRLDRRAVSI